MNILKPNTSKQSHCFQEWCLKNIFNPFKSIPASDKSNLMLLEHIILLLNLIYKPFKKVDSENLRSFTLKDSSSGNSSPTH